LIWFPGDTFMKIEATDADSSLQDYNRVSFYYEGREDPPKDTNRFAVNENGDVSVVSSLDKETDSTVTFVVTAKDSREPRKFVEIVLNSFNSA